MIAVILAAGIGSRLRPLTDSLPKCLLPVGGIPLLQRTLTALHRARIERTVIVTGYRDRQVGAFVGKLGLPLDVRLVFNARFRETNNNYSLWCAASACAGEEILLLDSDILFHPSILDRLLEAPQENALALRENLPGNPSLTEEEIKVAMTPPGRILRIGKDVPPRDSAGESLGIERFSRSAADRLFAILSIRKEQNEFYEAGFQQMIDEGVVLQAVGCGTLPGMEIDTLDDLRDAEGVAREIDA